jgi:biotin carboxylase
MVQDMETSEVEAVLVCGAGTHREFGLGSLLKAGLRVGVIEDSANIDASPAHAWLRSSVADAIETPALQELLAQGWGAAVCWGEFAMDTLSQILEQSAISGPRLDVRQVRDKHVMRRLLTEAGFAQPRYRLCRNLDELLAAQTELGGHVVVKALDLAGSAGVRLADDPQEAMSAQAGIALLGRRSMLCEEYLDGPEYSCEVLMVAGQEPLVYGVTEKFVTPPPVFFELGHAFPAFVQPDVHEQLVECAIRAAHTLGVVTATVHIELKLVDGRPNVIEVAGRLGGDEIPRLVHIATGLNPFVLEARALLGHPVSDLPQPHPPPLERAVSICLDADPGAVVDFTGVRQLLSRTELFRVRGSRTFATQGTTVHEATEGRVRIGQLVGMTVMPRPELAAFIETITAAV